MVLDDTLVVKLKIRVTMVRRLPMIGCMITKVLCIQGRRVQGFGPFTYLCLKGAINDAQQAEMHASCWNIRCALLHATHSCAVSFCDSFRG